MYNSYGYFAVAAAEKPRQAAAALQSLGDLELTSGDPARAFQLFAEGAPLFVSEQKPSGLAQVLTRCAILHKTSGNDGPAREAASYAREAARASGIPPLIEWVEATLAKLDQ